MKSIHLLAALLSSLTGLLPGLLSTTIVIGVSAQEEQDDEPSCNNWAKAGECSFNPNYMLQHCPIACGRQAEKDRLMAEEIENKIGHITSFYELEALDIDENVLKFDQLKGKVVVITNVASECGYTESHYDGLVQLYNRFKASPIGFDILAFPCNQFGEQEPGTCPEIKRFAESKDVEFTMMNKVDVNGMDAHLVYHYLKKVAGPPQITWNFASYYVITPHGVVSSFNGVHPLDLIAPVLEAMGASEPDGSSSDDEDEDGDLYSSDDGEEL
mmetsp:Transcript_10545/g.23005  ORF Transcript_10545/g.23005 Transcript_10545/m.23005 type:complete len:271 (+) Transcript_10545:135-947(+)